MDVEVVKYPLTPELPLLMIIVKSIGIRQSKIYLVALSGVNGLILIFFINN